MMKAKKERLLRKSTRRASATINTAPPDPTDNSPRLDEDNFEITIGKWHCVMAGGELTINDCGYDTQDQEDDPTYDFVRELWRLKNGKGYVNVG